MRSSLACVASGISPISSSSSVPFCATSKQPARRSEAPVKAPFSWPNSSLSISVSGSAAQLMATNGPCRRVLSACSERATSSLPVPLSPVIRTHARLGPACCSSAKISRICGDVPTRSPTAPLYPRFRSMARFSARNAAWLPARRIRISSGPGWIGFSRNQYAPSSCTVFTAVSMLPYAVSTIAGGISPASRSRARKPKPSRPGMFRSVRITSARKAASLRSASSPSAAVSAVMPQAETIAARPLRWLASSSTMSTLIGGCKRCP